MQKIFFLFIFVFILFSQPNDSQKKNSRYLKLLKSKKQSDVILGITLLSKNKQIENYKYLVPFLKSKNNKIIKTTLLAFSEYPPSFSFVNDEIFYNLKSSDVEIRRLAALVVPYSINVLQTKGIKGQQVLAKNKQTLKKAIYDKDDIVKKNLLQNYFYITSCFPIEREKIFLDLLKDSNSQIQLEILNSFSGLIDLNILNKYQFFLFNNKKSYVILKTLEIIKQKKLQSHFQKQIKEIIKKNNNPSVKVEANLLLQKKDQKIEELIKSIFNPNVDTKVKKKIIDSFVLQKKKGKSALQKVIKNKEINNTVFFHCLKTLYLFFPKSIDKSILYLSIKRADDNSYNLIGDVLVKNYSSLKKDIYKITTKLLEQENQNSRLAVIKVLKSTNNYNKKLNSFLYDLAFDENPMVHYNAIALIITKKAKDYLEFIDINFAEESGEIVNFIADVVVLSDDKKANKILKKYTKTKLRTYQKLFSKKKDVKNWYKPILNLAQKSQIYDINPIRESLVSFIKKNFKKDEILKIRIKANSIGNRLYFDLKE